MVMGKSPHLLPPHRLVLGSGHRRRPSALTATAWTCLELAWPSLTLQKLHFKLFLLPGEFTRAQNRPVVRLSDSRLIQKTAH